MPVYIRKNVSFTPPSIYNMQLEDDNDYLLDPDQMRDILPQPYRMINKILTQIVEDSWAVLEEKENALLADTRKARPPQLIESQPLAICGNATALTESVDGKIIFAGLPNGLAAFEAATQFPLHTWEENHAEITSIKTYLLSPDYHLILTIDDMGISRVFLFAFDHLFLVKAMNENHPEGSTKILCHKCEASREGDYLGISFENANTKDVWFEVLKMPTENWIKELEAIHAAIEKQKELVLLEAAAAETATVQESETEQSLNSKSLEEDQKSEEVIHTVESIFEKVGTKFSHPSIVFKAKPPTHRFPLANLSSSIASAVSKVDQGDVLGIGTNHVLSSQYLDSRDAMFTHHHQTFLEYLPAEHEEKSMSVNFHFTNPSHMITTGMDSTLPANKPVSVVLWWEATQHICHYSLLKSAKASLEENPLHPAPPPHPPHQTNQTHQNHQPHPPHQLPSVVPSGHLHHKGSMIYAALPDVEFKADIVWPCAEVITCSAISPCGSHMAVGLANGNLLLWDYQMGLPKATLTVNGNAGVHTVSFLDSSLFPIDPPHYPPYPVSAATFMLAEYKDGTQALFDTCDGSQQIPRVITSVPESDDELETLVKVIPDLPELMLYVTKSGSMYIKDIGTGATICEVCLPSTHSIQTPWNPILCLGTGGHVLYLKGEGSHVSEEGEVSDISCVFTFNLKEYPLLEEYWTRPREKSDLIVFTTCEQRLDALMKERLQQQAMRKPRMQKHWGQLRGELDIIQHAREIPVDSLRLKVGKVGGKVAPSSIQSIPEVIKFKTPRASII